MTKATPAGKRKEYKCHFEGFDDSAWVKDAEVKRLRGNLDAEISLIYVWLRQFGSFFETTF